MLNKCHKWSSNEQKWNTQYHLILDIQKNPSISNTMVASFEGCQHIKLSNVLRIIHDTFSVEKLSSKWKTRIVLNVSECVNATLFNANTAISSNFYEQFTNYCIIKLIVSSMYFARYWRPIQWKIFPNQIHSWIVHTTTVGSNGISTMKNEKHDIIWYVITYQETWEPSAEYRKECIETHTSLNICINCTRMETCV